VKEDLFKYYIPLLQQYKPMNICEIGTHDAKSAIQFIDALLLFSTKKQPLFYTGYDLFEDANDQLTSYEHNGKGPGDYKLAVKRLEKRKKKYKKLFDYKLIRGNTLKTLTECAYDFVYIDGGHSYDTVKADYKKVKDSKIIVFDDYQLPAVARAIDEIVDETKTTHEVIELTQDDRPKRKQVGIIRWTNTRHDQLVMIKS